MKQTTWQSRVAYTLTLLLITQASLVGQDSLQKPSSDSNPTSAAQPTLEAVLSKTKETWRPDLLVVRDGWETDRATVRRVIESAGSQIWRHLPQQKLKPIIVYPKGGPIVLYKRGPEGEIVLKLDTGKTYWAQYAFQFSHEICHVLCHYDQDPHGNNWFEESLCETASLFALRQMGQSWKTEPPYPNWKDYAKHLTQYAQDRIDASQLPAGVTIKNWYAENADALRTTSTNRELNNVLAVQMLPLFEADPSQWAAIAYLNQAKPKSAQTLASYLQDWHNESPEKHHKFIQSIAALFEIKLKP